MDTASTNQPTSDRDRLRELVEAHGNVVFFGGAGVSTESGIPDFRSQDGLYSQTYDYPPETIISRPFFDEHTQEFYEFYRDKMVFTDAKPNAAHKTLAKLEQQGVLSAVITQNIDGLHQMAGSKNVIELHGSIHRNICMVCGAHFGIEAILGSTGIPRCDCGGIIKPDVVLYEEPLDSGLIARAIEHIRAADMLIVAGTSLVVYPAAGFVQEFRGDILALVNKGQTPIDDHVDFLSREPIGTVLDW